MHRRQILFLNVVLAAVAFTIAWRLVADWKGFNLRYDAPPGLKTKEALVFPPTFLPAAAPAASEIAAKDLFSADRNDQVVLEKKVLQAPPIPIVFGTMNLGGKYEALMAEGGQPGRPAFRRVKNGEQIGGYKVDEIGDEKVVVDFQGEKKTINVYQSASSVPRLDARTGGSNPQQPQVVGDVLMPLAPSPQGATAASPAQPASIPSTPSALLPPSNDPYVKTTVEGNRRRIERQTPFGTQVFYEDIK